MKNQRRGKNIAIFGAILQAMFTVVLLVLWQMTNSEALLAGMWLSLGGVLTWIFTAVFFYASQLEQIEILETAELTEKSASIFDSKSDLALKPAAKRMVVFEKVAAPIVTILLAIYNAGLGYVIFQSLGGLKPTSGQTNPAAAVFLVLVGFGGFLFSRYSTGMSKVSC